MAELWAMGCHFHTAVLRHLTATAIFFVHALMSMSLVPLWLMQPKLVHLVYQAVTTPQKSICQVNPLVLQELRQKNGSKKTVEKTFQQCLLCHQVKGFSFGESQYL